MITKIIRPAIWVASIALVNLSVEGSANAGAVTLQSLDKSLSVSGELISYNGDTYILDGDLGEVEISASMVTCSGVDCPVFLDETKLSLVGSDVLGVGLLPSLMEHFSMENGSTMVQQIGSGPEEPMFVLTEIAHVNSVEVLVSLENPNIAYEEVINGTASFGMVSVAPDYDFTSASNLDGVGGLESKQIATNAIAVLASQDNPIDVLSMKQIAGMFSGQITNWAEVGGPDSEINVYTLDSSSSSAQLFADRILAPEGAIVTSDAQLFNSESEISRAITNNSNAIGFASLALSEGAKVLSLRGECGIVFSPTRFAIQTEVYPLTQQLHMVKSNGAQTSVAAQFWEFLDSDTAQIAVEYSGFVGTHILEEDFSRNGERLISLILAGQGIVPVSRIKEFVNDLRYAQRLSTALRFDYNSGNLSTHNEQQILQLASYIRKNYGTENKEIIVAGFTDTEGSDSFNAARSLSAARLVENRLSDDLSDMSISLVSKGYGEVSPVNCGVTPQENDLNQYVEIWIRDIMQ